ncbi:hypothetical protein C8R47DRAFT_1162389 [Mycena vitilis]|nr:hypothetical protein C8R47DRAFT_1162389 [Mycena vitilis]
MVVVFGSCHLVSTITTAPAFLLPPQYPHLSLEGSAELIRLYGDFSLVQGRSECLVRWPVTPPGFKAPSRACQ